MASGGRLCLSRLLSDNAAALKSGAVPLLSTGAPPVDSFGYIFHAY